MERRDAEFAKELPDYLNGYSYVVIGAAIEVHRHLGPGFLESAYEAALAVELGLRGINFRRQVVLPTVYKGHEVASSRLDLLVEDELPVELKAVESVQPIRRAQLLSYLKAGAFQLGLQINFNVPTLRDGVSRVISST